jgi:uncharacterized membrane protein YqjE
VSGIVLKKLKKNIHCNFLRSSEALRLSWELLPEFGGHATMHRDASSGRSLAAIVAEMKDELKESVQTRIEMLKAELQEKMKTLKIAVPLAALGALLLGTAYLLLTMALVGLTVAFFSASPYRWFFAFAIVAVLWTLLGGIATYFAKREFELKGLMPRKTIEVLKEDKIWIQAEAKNQL